MYIRMIVILKGGNNYYRHRYIVSQIAKERYTDGL